MSITASITVTQGASPENLIITDDTPDEGSQTYTDRYLTILDSEGEELADYPNPIDFPFSSDSITLTGFTVDLALNIVMTLVPTSVDPNSTYTATRDVAMNRYLQQGVYYIQQARFLDNALPGTVGVEAQLNSISIIIEEVNSQTAVLYGSLTSAQQALNRGQNIINNQII